ncbi:hypothetical protein J3E74DRAFT_288707 [Bipolaris maydis]|nr:hypothetical protein J3E74DRAFT_288707 [Bipolaris maydis]
MSSFVSWPLSRVFPRDELNLRHQQLIKITTAAPKAIPAFFRQPSRNVEHELSRWIPDGLHELRVLRPDYAMPGDLTSIRIVDKYAYVDNVNACAIYLAGTRIMLERGSGLSEDTRRWLSGEIDLINEAINATEPTIEQREFFDRLWNKESKAWMGLILWFFGRELGVYGRVRARRRRLVVRVDAAGV